MSEKVTKEKKDKPSKQYRKAEKFHVSTDPIARLNKDLRDAAKLMNRREARYLVDLYYQVQKPRKAAGEQIDRCWEAEEPTDLLRWSHANSMRVEEDIRAVLGAFAGEYAVGQWLQGICGIARVLSAGLLATFDVRERMIGPCDECKDKWQDKANGKGRRVFRPLNGTPDSDGNLLFECTGLKKKNEMCGTHKIINIHKDGRKSSKGIMRRATAGTFLRFAGQDPTMVWEKNQPRPWNAQAKVLCYLVGESFVKVQNNDKDIYGKIYAKRKAQEIAFNEELRFADQAEVKAKQVGKGTDAYRWYSKGKLPPAHIHARARRYAVRIFLSHFHHICHVDYYGKEPPIPYVFEHSEKNHTHYIPPPEIETNGFSLRKLYGEV